MVACNFLQPFGYENYATPRYEYRSIIVSVISLQHGRMITVPMSDVPPLVALRRPCETGK
jgi:hypothetical protein